MMTSAVTVFPILHPVPSSCSSLQSEQVLREQATTQVWGRAWRDPSLNLCWSLKYLHWFLEVPWLPIILGAGPAIDSAQ